MHRTQDPASDQRRFAVFDQPPEDSRSRISIEILRRKSSSNFGYLGCPVRESRFIVGNFYVTLSALVKKASAFPERLASGAGLQRSTSADPTRSSMQAP